MAILENDIIIENTDVQISVSGDFDIQSANNQNIKHICIAHPGNYPVSPSVGAMIDQFQNDNVTDLRTVLNTVAKELKKDGYSYPDFYNQSIDPEDLSISISAKRIAIPKREVI
jgi:hypothetical protein